MFYRCSLTVSTDWPDRPGQSERRPVLNPPPTDPTRRRRPSRRGEGAALREEIVEAADQLLTESNDASAVSLRAIARRVGIATTSIYLHFSDLNELLEAVSVARFDEFTGYLAAARDRSGPEAIDKVVGTLGAYVDFGIENPGPYAVMFTVERLPDARPQPIGLNSFKVLLDLVAAVRGRPADDREVHLLAVSLWTFVDGLVHLRASRPHFPWPDLDVQIDETTRRLLVAR